MNRRACSNARLREAPRIGRAPCCVTRRRSPEGRRLLGLAPLRRPLSCSEKRGRNTLRGFGSSPRQASASPAPNSARALSAQNKAPKQRRFSYAPASRCSENAYATTRHARSHAPRAQRGRDRRASRNSRERVRANGVAARMDEHARSAGGLLRGVRERRWRVGAGQGRPTRDARRRRREAATDGRGPRLAAPQELRRVRSRGARSSAREPAAGRRLVRLPRDRPARSERPHLRPLRGDTRARPLGRWPPHAGVRTIGAHRRFARLPPSNVPFSTRL